MTMEVEEGYVSSDHDDSDRELQVALEQGLLKPGLNFEAAAKRPPINNEAALESCLSKISKQLEWVERLDITSKRECLTSEPTPSGVNNLNQKEDDFQREISFYKQAQEALKTALPRLKKLGINTKRPGDYYAQMAKSDSHMNKVREKLLSQQQSKERSDSAKRLREERKFAGKVQQQVLVGRQSEKKRLLEAVKKHRKGMKEQLAEMLPDAQDKLDEQNAEAAERKPKKNKRREMKEKKFGFGGQKKRMKRNTASSSADISSFSAKKGVHMKPFRSNKGPKGKKKRLGKSRR